MPAGYRTIRPVEPLRRTDLAGGCYVVQPDDLALSGQDGFHWTRVIGAPEGALKLSQFLVEQAAGVPPVLHAEGHDAVLFILDGECELEIGGREFHVGRGCGAWVRTGETYAARSSSGNLRYLLSCCPGIEAPLRATAMRDTFDTDHPQRTMAPDQARREATGDRFFQVLVGPANGSTEVTQFIGMIPQSRAPEHFHQYEEAICVLRGHGRLWAGESHAPVGPGSIIFLPIRQPHCLECEDPHGMELVGLFYPAGSPAVSYATDAQQVATP